MTEIKDMTMDQVKEICIINSIKNWQKMSMDQLLNIEYNHNISIPQVSLDTIKEHFPILSENLNDIIYVDNKDIRRIKDIYGTHLMLLDKQNIHKIKMPATYYVLNVEERLFTKKREDTLHKMTFISHNKEDDAINAFYKNQNIQLYNDDENIYGSSANHYAMYGHMYVQPNPVYIFTD